MSKDLYGRPHENKSDGQGLSHRGPVSRVYFSSRGALRSLGGPIKRPGSKFASEYRSPSRAIIMGRCGCGGRILSGGQFPACDSCGKEAVQTQYIESARERAKKTKRFMKSMRRAI